MKKLIAIIFILNAQILICTQKSSAQFIDSAEYFYDIDPGVGNGTAIALTPADTILDSIYTNTIGLTSGFHNLYVRVKDTNNVWSLYEGGRLYLYDTLTQSIPTSHPLSKGEYFYDTDPGVGNGIPLPSFATADSILVTDTIPSAPLTAGTHYLYVRVQDTLNRWSLAEGKAFVICNFVPVADFSADTVCLYSTTNFTDFSSNLDTNYTYAWDFNNDHLIDDTTKGNTSHAYSTSGTHTVTLIVNNTLGCTDTIIKTVYVDTLPTVTLNLTIDTICHDDTITLSGGFPAGGIFSGQGVYSGLFYADSVSNGLAIIKYTYYNADSCTAFTTDKIYVSPCTGIQEYQNVQFTATLTPNPFRTSTLIQLQGLPKINHRMNVVLLDVFGKEIRKVKIEKDYLKLERENLPAGVYFYQIINEAGNYLSGKLVVID